MSEVEKDLLRLRSWDTFEQAKDNYRAHKAKLSEWGRLFSRLGKGLSENPVNVGETSFEAVPTHQQYSGAIREFKQTVAECKLAWVSARDFGWPVGEYPEELGPL